jgi:hypothetical protein
VSRVRIYAEGLGAGRNPALTDPLRLGSITAMIRKTPKSTLPHPRRVHHQRPPRKQFVVRPHAPEGGSTSDENPAHFRSRKAPGVIALALAGLSLFHQLSLADTVYLSTGSANSILRFAPNGVASVFATSGLNVPCGLAFDASGNLFVANDGGDSVLKITPAGVSTVFANSNLGIPYDLAFDPKGNLFVVNNRINTLVKFTPQGVGTVIGDSSSGINTPSGMACDAAGNAYVLNGNQTIEKFAPDGTHSIVAGVAFTTTHGVDFATDLAFDHAGNMYVGNRGDNTITKFTPGGTWSVFATFATGVNVPYGMAFDSSDNLYVVNNGNHTIEQFTPEGTGTVFANISNVSQPEFIAIVPEPSSVGLTLACGVGWLVRQLSKRRAGSGPDPGNVSP